jgi:hypothetical protein
MPINLSRVFINDATSMDLAEKLPKAKKITMKAKMK